MYKVIEARIMGHLAFRVHFSDGLSGTVRVLPSCLRGEFAELADPDFFAQMCVIDGYVTWPNQLDIPPEKIYWAISESGEWVMS